MGLSGPRMQLKKRGAKCPDGPDFDNKGRNLLSRLLQDTFLLGNRLCIVQLLLCHLSRFWNNKLTSLERNLCRKVEIVENNVSEFPVVWKMHKSQGKEERKPGGIFSRGYFAKSSSSLQDGGEKWFNQGRCTRIWWWCSAIEAAGNLWIGAF